MKKVASKLLSVLLVVILTLSMAACGSTAKDTSKEASKETPKETPKEKFPTRPISVIVSYAAGGGTDLGARTLMPFVEKELGVPMTVINKAGAGGWLGWLDLLGAKPDGYTIAMINTPNLITGYVDPQQKRKENLDSFSLIGNQVTDAGVIAVRKDEKRFTNMKELVEYAKKNELTTTSTGIAGDDHIAALKLNKEQGTKFNAVHNKGVAESITSVLGGHVDVMFANVGEVTNLYNNKEINVLAVMSEKRAISLPNVPTLKELGLGEIYSWSARGFAAAKGVDAENMKILIAAFEKAIKNPDHIKKMADMGLEVDYKDPAAYYKALQSEEKSVNGLKSLLGW